IDIVARAHAVVTATAVASSRTFAVAAATADVPIGILQGASGTDASASLQNSGSIVIAASAAAAGPQNVFAQVNERGIGQVALASGISATAVFSQSNFTTSFARFFQGPAKVSLANSGTISVDGLIDARGGGVARIDAHE